MIAERSSNGTETEGQPSFLRSRLIDLVDEHLALLSLESRFEADQAAKRLTVLIGAAACVLLSLIGLQVGMILALARAGFSMDLLCAGLGVLWGIGGYLLYRYGALRDPRIGGPFEGSRQEFSRSLQWIRKHSV